MILLEGSGALGELEELPGLGGVKEQLATLLAVARAEVARRDAGITLQAAWKHLAFAGPPGTGKSRVAAILARAYREIGVLSGGHLVEVTRAGLSGERPADTSGPGPGRGASGRRGDLDGQRRPPAGTQMRARTRTRSGC